MMTRKIITIHIDYDPNVADVPTDVGIAADVAVETLAELQFKAVIERRLRNKLTPEQFKLIRVQVN